MVIYTQWNKPPTRPDKIAKKVMVKKAGYVPIKKQVEVLVATGKRLRADRELMYDYQPGENIEDDGRYDPTREPGVDPVDIQRLAESIKPIKAASAEAGSREKPVVPEKKVEPPPAGG